MRPLHVQPLTAAALVTALLGGVLLAYAVDSPLAAYAVLSGSAAGVAGSAAMVMATRDPFPARVAATVVCVTSALGAVLAMTVGLPGGPAAGLTLRGATLVACGLLVPVLLAAHAASRPSGTSLAGPYAR